MQSRIMYYKCGDGYEFVNNNFHSVCGDQIVTKQEELISCNIFNKF
ncbi:unnamed protein product [Paramecium octaurelia]|uniref:Uncharacterized protein n=1 Tax=Paramecium octaurelia TaxID=43137 RepID=A0A8S1UDS7_PAROT|nr:unnamed protein product [Paramecium octaurelia]